MTLWLHRHIIGHHIYTNVMGADPDLPHEICGDPRRLAEQQKQSPKYRWQHLYLPPMYGILAFQTRLEDLMQLFPRLAQGPLCVNPINTSDCLRMVSFKCVWSFYRLVMPYAILEVVSAVQLVWLVVVTEFASGYWMAFNLQVSHATEDVDFLFSDVAKAEKEGCAAFIDDEWAHSQVKTTVDYAHDSWMTTYFFWCTESSNSTSPVSHCKSTPLCCDNAHSDESGRKTRIAIQRVAQFCRSF